MVKQKWLIISLSFLSIFVIVSTYLKFWPQKSNSIPKQEFKIQGVTWRTYSYYYHSFIYLQGYNFWANWRFLKKVKKVGANFLLVEEILRLVGYVEKV